MIPTDDDIWTADWVWSLPLIFLNGIIHVLGLRFINEWVVKALTGKRDQPARVLGGHAPRL